MPPHNDHTPVMPREVTRYLSVQPGDTIIDGTFGAGGHARMLAEELSGEGEYIGIDRDPGAVERFAVFAREIEPIKTRFLNETYVEGFKQLLADGVSASAVILDVGVSSMQLDNAERGFSYMSDAPLDMRMNPADGQSAADLLNHLDEAEITRILREYGEERYAHRIAKRIVKRREQNTPVQRTLELVDVIRSALPHGGARQKGGHPAKRVFQALRIAVNDELGQLKAGLDQALQLLQPGGVLLVLSFQSLEDRIVKQRFAQWAGSCKCPPGLPVCSCNALVHAEVLTRSVVRPKADEIAQNSRSASTKLRAVRRVDPPQPLATFRRAGAF